MKSSSKKSTTRRETAPTTTEEQPTKAVATEPTVAATQEKVDTEVVPQVDAKAASGKEEEEANNPVNVYMKRLNQYVSSIATMNKELKELVTVGKGLEKDFNNIVKLMAKKSKTKSGERRHPSGFAVASILSDEMYQFLNISKGEKVPRKDVTRMMNDYITKNSLRDPSDKRIIIPNEDLHRIFKSTTEDKITYFNLQSYIKHHFIKEQAAH